MAGTYFSHDSVSAIKRPTAADTAYDNTSTSANSNADSVNSALQNLGNSGTDALNSAVDAIKALGDFKPTEIKVTYTPPKFEANDAASEPTFTDSSSSDTTDITATDLAFKYNVPAITEASDSVDAPTIPEFPTLTAPDATDSITEPTAPPEDTLSEVTEPAELNIPAFTLNAITEATLKDLEYETLTTFQDPSTKIPDMIAKEPEKIVPVVFVDDSQKYESEFFQTAYEDFLLPKYITEEVNMNDWNKGVDESKPRNNPSGAASYQNGIGALIQSFAQPGSDPLTGGVSNSTLAADSVDIVRGYVDYAKIARERRRLTREYYADSEQYYAWVQKAFDAHMRESKITIDLFKLCLESKRFQIETHLQTVQMATALYNAKIVMLKSKIDEYRLSVQAKLTSLDVWKAKLSAEIAKVKGNAAKGQIYAARVSALATKVSAYNAQVDAEYTKIDLFKSSIDAMLTKADVAKSSLGIYAAQVDAYVASLTAYKSQYEQYNAAVRATSAKNALTASKTKLSASGMAAAGAKAILGIAKTELDVEKLKAQIINESSNNESLKLSNLIEQVKAQVDTQKGRAAISKWVAEATAKSIPYDAYALNASSAARFYETASNAAYRASEQSLKAVLAATEASAIAQEAAARSGASVAQGAYSATHYSMSLSASGRESAEKSASVRDSFTIGHTYQLTDEQIEGLTS